VLRARGIATPLAGEAAAGGTIIALVGAPGGQGVSTLAAGLTVALSRTAPAVLVDLDLVRPTQALALDLNPARNLSMVLHEAGDRDDPRVWARLLESELQPLDPSVPQAVVLAGAPGPVLAASVGSESVHRVLRQLARYARYVVADVGSELDRSAPVADAHRSALEAADRVLVVARADLVGLRRTAHLLDYLRAVIDHHEDRLALVLNQHQPRHHHDAVEVARALQTPVAAVIPDDPQGVQAALAAQRPLLTSGRGRRGSAARSLMDLSRAIQAATAIEEPQRITDRQIRGFTWRRPFWALAWQGKRP
jgi:Flp pilus assembly CpaE family ATPase